MGRYITTLKIVRPSGCKPRVGKGGHALCAAGCGKTSSKAGRRCRTCMAAGRPAIERSTSRAPDPPGHAERIAAHTERVQAELNRLAAGTEPRTAEAEAILLYRRRWYAKKNARRRERKAGKA